MNNWEIMFCSFAGLGVLLSLIVLIFSKESYLNGEPAGIPVSYAIDSSLTLFVLIAAGFFKLPLSSFSIPQILMLFAVWPLRKLIKVDTLKDELFFLLGKAILLLALFYFGRAV